MPLPLIPIAAASIGAWWLANRDDITNPQQTPSQQYPNTSPANAGASINLTTIAGYLVLGGLVYYFGRRLIA